MPLQTFPASPVPTWVYDIDSTWNTLIIDYGNLVEQRIALNSTAQKAMAARWRSLTNTNRKIITDFFDARKGSFEAFTFVDPTDSTSRTVRFLRDKINASYFNYLLWELNTVEFLEVGA